MAENEFGGSHIINIDDSVNSTRGKSNYCPPDALLIRKIESIGIYDERKADYEPNVLSIGPYHNGNHPAKTMQIEKYECLEYVLNMNRDKKLEDYMKAIRGIEKRVRNCYGDEIEMDRNNFLKMLLLDGCFVIYTLHEIKEFVPSMPDISTSNKGIIMKTYENYGETVIDIETLESHENQQNIQTKEEDAVDEDDSYRIRKWYLDLFSSDLLLLGNQIPFFVVTEIYEIATGGSDKTPLLTESVTEFIEGMIKCYPKSITAFDRPKDFHHLLHLCHMYFKPSKGYLRRCNSIDHKQAGPWRRATEYSKSGICMKKKEFCSDDPHSLLDIDFLDGKMEIPCLDIDHNTICLFRTLIALEQTSTQLGNDVTAYVVFLSQFIGMPDDVALLTKRGIILHQLNSDAEVSDLFTKLREDIVLNFNGNCYLNCTYHEIEEHYRRSKARLMPWLGEIASKCSMTFSAVTRK